MSLSNTSYKSSIYKLVDIQNGQVGVGTGLPVFRTQEAGLELGRHLLFTNRPLGIGAETEYLSSNISFVLNQNIPSSYIHIDAPSNSSNIWAVVIDSSNVNQDEITRDVHVGSDGTIYSTTECDVNYPVNIHNPDGTVSTFSSLSQKNIYKYDIISSYQPCGVRNWSSILGTTTNDGGQIYASRVQSDTYGNVYVAGYSETSFRVFDSNLNSWWSNSSNGAFVVKYNQVGAPIWVSSIKGNTGQTYLYNQALDTTCNALYVAGSVYFGSLATSNLPLTFTNSSNGIITSNVFTIKNKDMSGWIGRYDLNGNVQWINQINGINDEAVKHMAVDKNNNILFATTVVNPYNSSNVTMQSQNGSNLIISGSNGSVIGKYSSQGNAIWGVNISTNHGNSNIYGKMLALATDVNNNAYVVIENAIENLLITNGDNTKVTVRPCDIHNDSTMLLKFNANGIYQWKAEVGDTIIASDSSYDPRNYAGLTTDSAGNVYMSAILDYPDNFFTYNSDNSSNAMLHPYNHDICYTSYIFKINPQGFFTSAIAHMDSAYEARVSSIALDENRRRLYAGTYGYDNHFYLFNREGMNVYSYSNLNKMAGFVLGMNMDTGDIVPSGITLTLPAQETSSFQKDLYFTSLNTVPYTAYLELENVDHTFKYMPIILEKSNVTVQKSFQWTSNAWVQNNQFLPTANGVNLISYYYGDQSFAVSGSNYIGANITWQNKTLSNKLAFRVTTKCSLASEYEIAYRQFEALVSPVDNEANHMPYGIVSAEVGDTYGTVFTNLDHTIVRHSDRSVTLKVKWDSVSADYIGNIELHVLASTRLGDITFDPIHG